MGVFRLATIAAAATVIITGILLTLNYMPRATVKIIPATEERQMTQSITLSQSQKEPDFRRFILPAKIVEAEVAERQDITRMAGGVKDDFARGTVTLINNQSEEQALLPQTHLKHEKTGVFFLTDQAVRVPPRGQIEIKVTAKEAGSGGNVPPGKFTVDKLSASLQQVVYGESGAVFTGGQIVENPVTEDELAAAKERVRKTAEDNLHGKLTAETGGASVLPELTHIETLSEEVNVTPGSQATSYEASLRLRGRAFIANQADLLSLTLLTLRAAAQADEDFAAYKPESFTAEILRADFDRGEAKVTGSLTGVYAKKMTAESFSPANLAGLTEAEAQELLKKDKSVSEVKVQFWPFWVKTIPARKGAAEVVLEQAKEVE